MKYQHIKIYGGFCLLIALPIFLTACGSEDSKPSQPITLPDPDPLECSSHQGFFQSDVWPILKSRCFVCHEIDNVSSDLNLVDETFNDFNLLNFNSFRAVAAKRDGNERSLILSKPTNSNGDHNGGALFDENASEFGVFQEMVDKLDRCVDTKKNLAGLVHDTPYQQLRKTTLALSGRLPTLDEEQAVDAASGDIALQQTAFNNIIDQLFTEEPFYARLKHIFNDLLLLDAFPGTRALSRFDLSNFPNDNYFTADALDEQGYSSEDRNQIRQDANYGLSQAPLALIAHVVKNDRPFTEILTADYLLVNPYTATLFSADVNDASFSFKYGDAATLHDRNNFKEAKLQGMVNDSLVNYPHAGLLTTLTYLTRYPSTNTNRNRARSRYTFLYFLDTNVEGLADRAGLNLDNVIGDFPTYEDPQCRVCHDTVDPIAGLFKNWNNRGRYIGDNKNWFSERNPQQMLVPGYTIDVADQLPESDSDAAMRWLANRIAQDSRFSLSMVKTVFTGFTGQKSPQDPQFLETLRAEFVDSNFNLKVLIKKIVSSVYFTAANLGDDEDPADFTNIGMGHLLTPEQLHRKISAVTGGYSWRSPSNRDLRDLTTYNLLYGGIDSDTVTERTTAPTSLMVGVQQRIALQASCNAVVLDFDKVRTSRSLFPGAEITDTPETALGAIRIRQNIQHLYKQLLGEEVAIDAPEINQTFQLFVDVRDITPVGEIPTDCRNGLPSGHPVRIDNNKTVRPWMAVVAHLMSDYRFFYE
ncbi:MAG: DUF1553 domain-containing protein [Gammaproteobacteria bacterium]|nr:DUF1553 domain-containing protein [Gammaproteobacteria bacterium]